MRTEAGQLGGKLGLQSSGLCVVNIDTVVLFTEEEITLRICGAGLLDRSLYLEEQDDRGTR